MPPSCASVAQILWQRSMLKLPKIAMTPIEYHCWSVAAAVLWSSGQLSSNTTTPVAASAAAAAAAAVNAL
jgi:hypothetical protein